MNGSIFPLTQQVLEPLALRCVSLYALLTLLFTKSGVDGKSHSDYKGGSGQTVEVVPAETDALLTQRWPHFLLFD